MLTLLLLMALAFDSADTGGSGTGTSITKSHTCTGSELILTVGTGQVTFAGDSTPTATYAAAGMTQKGTALRTNVFTLRTTGFYKVSPATGANNIVVTYTNAGDTWAAGVSHTGNDVAGTPVGTEQTGSGSTDPSSLTVTSATGEVVISIVTCAQPTLAVNQSETSRAEVENINFTESGGIATKAGAASVGTGWTFGTGGASDDWAAVAFPIKPSGGAGASIVPILMAQYRHRAA